MKYPGLFLILYMNNWSFCSQPIYERVGKPDGRAFQIGLTEGILSILNAGLGSSYLMHSGEPVTDRTPEICSSFIWNVFRSLFISAHADPYGLGNEVFGLVAGVDRFWDGIDNRRETQKT